MASLSSLISKSSDHLFILSNSHTFPFTDSDELLYLVQVYVLLFRAQNPQIQDFL